MIKPLPCDPNVKLTHGAQALGMEVTVISTSPHKEKEARKRLGADNFIVSKNQEQMAVRSLRGSLLSLQAHSCHYLWSCLLVHHLWVQSMPLAGFANSSDPNVQCKR